MPEEGQPEDDPHDAEAWGDQRPPRARGHRAAPERVVEHLSPRERGRVAEAEEGERAFVEDRERDDQHRVDHEDRHDQRQDVMADDMPIARADGFGAQDKLARLDRQRLRADDARGGCPAEQADDEDDVEQGWFLGKRNDDDHQRQVGDDEHDVGEAHEQVFDAPAVEARHDAEHAADENRDEGREETDDERDARPEDEIGEYVFARVVGADPMLCAGRIIDVAGGDVNGGLDIVRRDDAREDRHEDDDDQHNQADESHLVAMEDAPKVREARSGGSRG